MRILERILLPLLLAIASLLVLPGAIARDAQGAAPSAAQDGTSAVTVPDQVAHAYRWGDFDELERLYAVFAKPGVRSPATGNPRIDHFWMGIGQINNSNLRVTDDYYRQLDALTGKWAHDHPRSVLARLLLVDALRTHAWACRGGGYADTVSPTARAGFQRYLGMALAQLRDSESMAAHDSSWSYLMLNVGRGLDWETDRLLAVFQEGVARNRDHDNLYFSMEEALLPKWGGSVTEVERFIDWTVQSTRDTRGMEMYARLYAGLSYMELHQTLFTGSHASWPLMKAGFEDLLKRYPHVDHRNMYAYFACMAGDRDALRTQLDQIGDGFESMFWGDSPERTWDDCRKLVRGA